MHGRYIQRCYTFLHLGDMATASSALEAAVSNWEKQPKSKKIDTILNELLFLLIEVKLEVFLPSLVLEPVF